MHSKVTIVVKRLHWCCVSCHVVSKHTVSIDEHLKSCHLDLICLSSETSSCPSPDLELDDFSEGDLDLRSELDKTKRTTKEELAEITRSPDLCIKSLERTTEREFSEITPSPVSVKTKETVQHERNETVSSQSKNKTSNFSKSPISISDTFEHSHQRMRTRNLSNIPINLSKTRETTNSKSEVRTINLTNSSVGMQETDSEEKVHFSHVQKTRLRQPVHRLTINRKENQDISSVSSTGEPNSGKAREQLKKEHRPQRKRQRLQLNSCHEDVHKEQICTTDIDQPEMEDTEIWKENFKSSGVKTDKDIEASTQKKSRSGHPKCSEKPKETVRKRLKTVAREMKKYSWGGKPVKRSLEITEEKMKHVILSYIGSEMSRNYDKNTPAHLHPAEVNCKPQIAVGNIHTVVDSDPVKSDLQYPMSYEILGAVAGTPVPAIPGRHTDVTKASRTETSNVNASLPPEEGCQSHPVVQLQVYRENVHSCHHDNQRSCSTMRKEPEIVPQTLSIDDISQTLSAVCETECPPRHLPSASSHEKTLAASTILVLPDTDKSSAQNTDDSFKNMPQTDSVCGQQDAFKMSKSVEDKCCYFENDGKSTDCEDWVKSRTNFSFSKAKAATSFEQPSKVYECKVCQAKFSTAENLSDHFVKMSHHKAAQCQSCQRPYHNVYDLNFHVFEDHERRSIPFCFDCGEHFQNLATLEKHLHQHKYNCDPKVLDMEYHSCNICETDVPCRYETLRKHYHKHKMTMCFECFVRSKLVLLPNTISVRKHKTMHANFCNVCFQDFPSVEALNDHYPCQSDCVRQEDGQGKLCDRCSQWCPNKASVTLHHKEHKLQVMRKWRVEKWGVGIPCVYCDKVLRNKRNLERHIAQLHSSCRSYNFHCEFCGKGIDSKNILKDHIAVHHLGIKRYSCEYCHLRFACAPTLRRHILREHATDRQYTCEVCGERFCEKFKLTRHMYVHTGSARFMCEQCGKGFHSSSEFKKHLAVHEDKRVFTCQQCGQEYKRKEHLKRHVQKCTRSGHNNAQADSQVL